MEILELNLQHYGKFENHTIRLKPGVNIIYGGNETGKSTIHSFLRAMLFGLNRARGKAARSDEFQIRQPWDSPGAFMGSMRIREQGEIYRIDRCFDRSAQPLRVVCETTPWEAPQPEQAMERLLGGVGEAAFVNTLFIPQTGAETGEPLAQELRRYMLNSEGGGDGQTDVARALQNLRRRKKQLEQKKKKEDEALEARIEKSQARAETLRAQLAQLRHQIGLYGGAAGSGSAQPQEYGVPDPEESGDAFFRRSRRAIFGLLALAGILALAAAWLLQGWLVRLFFGALGAAFFAMLVPANTWLSASCRERQEMRPDGLNPGDARPLLLPGGPTEAEEAQRRYLSGELGRCEEAYRKQLDELETLYQAHVKPDGLDTEIAAITMAIDRICDLSSGIYEQSGRRLNERASGILAELTDGRYQRILLDETAEVRIHTPSRVLGLHQVSGGTMQQIYFALRMAAAELLCGGRELPVVLDEPFALYDDARLEAALRWLKRSGRQVILFTCQRREKEILERIQ